MFFKKMALIALLAQSAMSGASDADKMKLEIDKMQLDNFVLFLNLM